MQEPGTITGADAPSMKAEALQPQSPETTPQEKHGGIRNLVETRNKLAQQEQKILNNLIDTTSGLLAFAGQMCPDLPTTSRDTLINKNDTIETREGTIICSDGSTRQLMIKTVSWVDNEHPDKPTHYFPSHISITGLDYVLEIPEKGWLTHRDRETNRETVTHVETNRSQAVLSNFDPNIDHVDPLEYAMQELNTVKGAKVVNSLTHENGRPLTEQSHAPISTSTEEQVTTAEPLATTVTPPLAQGQSASAG
jgi:hypothetical protein